MPETRKQIYHFIDVIVCALAVRSSPLPDPSRAGEFVSVQKSEIQIKYFYMLKECLEPWEWEEIGVLCNLEFLNRDNIIRRD